MKENTCVQIHNFIERLKEDGKSEFTVKNYQRTMNEFEQFLMSNGGSLDNLTRLDVKQFISHLQDKGNSNSTITNKHACLATYCRYIKRLDVLEDISVPKIRNVKHIAPKSLERNERNKLLREVERKGNSRDTAITYLLLQSGLRVSELTNLNLQDITLNERSGSVLVRNGKGNIDRKVPLSNEARLHLLRYLNSRQDDNEAVFLSNYKKRISVRTVQYMLKQFKVSPHILRHSFARELVAIGTDISTVADLCGHSDVNTTRRYTKASENDLINAIDKAFSS